MIKKLFFNFDLNDNNEKELYELLSGMNQYKRTYYILTAFDKLKESGKFTRLEKKLLNILDNKKIVYKEPQRSNEIKEIDVKPAVKTERQLEVKKEIKQEVKENKKIENFKIEIKPEVKEKNIASVLDEKLDSITDEGFKWKIINMEI